MSVLQPVSLLNNKAIVITPNNRLSQEVIKDYYAAHPENILEKPLCMPYEQFIGYLFHEFCHNNPTAIPPVLLTQQQLEFLWLVVIGDLGTPGITAEVIEAWRRCLLWQVDFNRAEFSLTPQALQFQTWASLVDKHLKEINAITLAEIVPYLLKHQCLIPEQTVVWYCFDDFSPQQKALQNHITTQGANNLIIDLPENNQVAYLCQAKSNEDETLQLITWISHQLANKVEHIGIVMPDIAENGESLLRALKHAFPDMLFNISLGKPLYTYPLVAHALSWLFCLDRDHLSNEQARLLLYTPFLANAHNEFFERCQALEDCKSLEEISVNFSLFLEELTEKTPKLANTLKSINPFPAKASVTEWGTLFIERLNHLGFPGDSPLDSYNYQCYHRFLTLFELFQSMQLLSPVLSKADALSAFSALTNATFQPETVNAQIEILGVLEASGRRFDSLWMLGLTQDAYPQKTQPSAFIPIDIQRELNMPRATNERELTLAIKQITRFIASSSQCVFSYPRFDGDKPNLPCALLSTLPPLEQQTMAAKSSPSQLEPFSDDALLALKEDERIAGGTRLLANQAKCPFRAFAAHRLHARACSHYTDGLTHFERGRALHQVLELIWLTVGDQRTLLSMSEEQLTSLVNSAVNKALAPLAKWRPYSFSSIVAAVESHSLARRAQVCLTWDKHRPAFTVEQIEADFSYALGPLVIQLRIDRLDRLANGKKWVIDYKSSMPQALPWNEERPQEPQLLMYSLLDEQINGLLFLSLKEGKLACKGISDHALGLSGILSLKENEQWLEKRAGWKTQLETLATEFYQGHCAPKPLNGTLCTQCEYKPLCRFKSTH